MNKIKNKGFSLMELIITITIIFVLSVISGPIYKTNSTKTKMAEGYALLGTIRSAQEAYFRTYDNFLFSYQSSSGNNNHWTCNETVLGIDARPNRYYTKFTVCRDYDSKKGFLANVLADGYPGIIMEFNLTTGVTFK
ncbi:MAG: prepilin-type N-terminal cleavage/methylation domain-containing protein [Elusimicrobia bacterium]|nr:prepilin-type N-terminal cleavage/methylation domain-containing protein [Elusimicrobiota bacterium]